jgi:hypothetical protein
MTFTFPTWLKRCLDIVRVLQTLRDNWRYIKDKSVHERLAKQDKGMRALLGAVAKTQVRDEWMRLTFYSQM